MKFIKKYFLPKMYYCSYSKLNTGINDITRRYYLMTLPFFCSILRPDGSSKIL